MTPEMQILLADRKLGPASKLAFWVLWDFAGGQPGEIVITADWLAGRCGRDPSAARQWLRRLQQHDLIAMLDRDERKGTIHLAVYNPCPGDREATPDPQTRLPFGPVEPAAHEASSAPPVAEVSEPKPPRPLVPKKDPKNLLCQSTKESKDQCTKESKAPKDPKSGPPAARLVDVERPVREQPGPMTAVMDAIAAEVLARSAPAAQKARIKARIQNVCYGQAADWVAGAAANLVVYHGVPYQDLERILADVDAMRAAGSLRDAGAFFHSKARQLALRHGATWPRQRHAEVPAQKAP